MVEQVPRGVSLPCFSPQIAGLESLLWLPVAQACNMRCAFCGERTGRSADIVSPGLSLSPEDAVERVNARVERSDALTGVVLWGPGEPLVNAATYTVLQNLHWLYPDLPVTVCTNGILLPERLEGLVRNGVKRIVVSTNAISVATAERIYESVNYRARRYEGTAAAELALQQQWNGLENAVDAGLAVTAYAANIAGVNDHEILEIEQRAKAVGVENVTVVDL